MRRGSCNDKSVTCYTERGENIQTHCDLLCLTRRIIREWDASTEHGESQKASALYLMSSHSV